MRKKERVRRGGEKSMCKRERERKEQESNSKAEKRRQGKDRKMCYEREKKTS